MVAPTYVLVLRRLRQEDLKFEASLATQQDSIFKQSFFFLLF